MLDLFKEVIPSILQTKKRIVALENESEYNPFVVNRSIGQHIDCVLYANEMNIRPFLDKRLQYDYLRKSIRKYRRPFQKWFKKEKAEFHDVVKEYYGLSDSKTIETLNILTLTQLEQIAQKMI